MTVLVTGATGLIGRALIRQLTGVGAHVRAMSRNPDAMDLPVGVEKVGGDVSDAASLAPALSGVERMYLFSAAHAGDGFAEVTRAAGVRRVVVLSGVSDPEAVEKPLGTAGLGWTHLRPGAFASNALWQWGEPIRANGTVRGAYLDAYVAPIHEADIAAVARTALLDDGHEEQRYVLRGPEPITYREQVAEIARATGREISALDEPHEQTRERMARYMPEEVVDRLLAVWADSVGNPPVVEPTVERVTGHPGRTFARWAADHAAAFR